MISSANDTIVAIASAAGGARRGIVRGSGPDIPRLVRTLLEPGAPAESQASCWSAQLRLDATRRLSCQVYYWPTSRSYTRQPSLELHLPGSPPLLDAALSLAIGAGARLATPGEFTLRAFLAGRLDLTQAEAVLGVIDSENRDQLRRALDQLAGGLSAPLTRLRDRLLDLLAHLEAGLDFAEEDIEFISAAQLASALEAAMHEVDQLRQQLTTRHRGAASARLVLYGYPNVGKSELFNALVGRPEAIVTNAAGTTRDWLSAEVEFNGVACELVDTAGYEMLLSTDTVATPTDGIRAAAQRMMRDQRQFALVAVLCLDRSRAMNTWELQAAQQAAAEAHLTVHTKADLPPHTTHAITGCEVSSLTGAGLDILRDEIARRVVERTTAEGGALAATAARCSESIRRAGESLARAHELTLLGGGEELSAAEIRVALDELGQVAGTVYTDDILDRIFSRFCIGK